MSDDQQVLQGAAQSDPALLQTLRGALKGASEAQRGQILADLLADWARDVARSTQQRAQGDGEKLRAAVKKLQELEHAKADLEDSLSMTRAQLVERDKRLEAEQARATELLATAERQKARIATLQEQLNTFEARATEQAAELHAIEREREKFEIKSQRLEIQTADRSQLEAIQAENRRLAGELQQLRDQHEALRQEKQSLEDALQEQQQNRQSEAHQAASSALHDIWRGFAELKPPLVRPGAHPNAEAAERLVKLLAHLVTFAQKSEQNIRPFLNKYTRYNPSVSKPWKVYADKADKEDLYQVLRQILDPEGAKSPEFLGMKLKVAERWAFAAMLCCDNLIELIPQELQGHLMRPEFGASDPKFTIREYVRRDGPTLFLEHLQQIQGQKLAEMYGLSA